MKIARKLAIATTAAVLSLGVAGVASAPAAHADTSWGCGGLCKTR